LVTSAEKEVIVRYAIVSEKRKRQNAPTQPSMPTAKPTKRKSGAPRMLRRQGM